MTPLRLVPAVDGQALRERWRAEVESLDLGLETILAWLELDLDAQLRFGAGLVVLALGCSGCTAAQRAHQERALPGGRGQRAE